MSSQEAQRFIEYMPVISLGFQISDFPLGPLISLTKGLSISFLSFFLFANFNCPLVVGLDNTLQIMHVRYFSAFPFFLGNVTELVILLSHLLQCY